MDWHRHIRRLLEYDSDEAFRAAKSALRIHPGAIHLYWLRSDMLVDRRRQGEAELLLQAGLKLDPEDPRSLVRLAALEVRRGEFSRARCTIAASIASPRPHWKTRQEAAALYLDMADPEAARDVLAGEQTLQGYSPPPNALLDRIHTALTQQSSHGARPGDRQRLVCALEEVHLGNAVAGQQRMTDLIAQSPDNQAAIFALDHLRRYGGLPFDPRSPTPIQPMAVALPKVASPLQLQAASEAWLPLDPGGRVVTFAPTLAAAGQAPELVRTTTEPAFMAVIENALVVGRGVVLRRGVAINELLADHQAAKFHAVRDNDQLTFDRGWFRDGLCDLRLFERPALLLAGPTDRAFGDWIINFAPRLALAAQAGLSDFTVVVGDEAPSHAIDLLSALGFPRDRLWVHDSRNVSVFRRLYAPSWPMRRRLQPMAGLFDVFGSVRARQAPPQRLYLSREFVATRPMTNEPAVRALFERHGFRVIHPERLGFQDVVDAFANADAIAGPYGSAWLNAAFNRRGASCLVLAAPDPLLHRQEVSVWIGSLGLPFGVEVGVAAGDDQWTMDLQATEKAIGRLLTRGRS